jgi:predicted PilT family ATPase
MVELWGEKAFVDKALEMITEILALNMMKTKENRITLTVSHHDAGAIIGNKRTQLNRIKEDTGVNIKVEGLVKGNLDRLVELWGHKVSVDKALQMIKKIIQR